MNKPAALKGSWGLSSLGETTQPQPWGSSHFHPPPRPDDPDGPFTSFKNYRVVL